MLKLELETVVKSPTFARHESFHIRYSWLKKCYDRVEEYPDIFKRPDATVLLGVGKNMVRAICFWGRCTKIIEKDAEKPGNFKTTEIGKMIFAEDGIDPYLEHTDTLWIIHWLIYAKHSLLPVWWTLMNDLDALVIAPDKLTKFAVNKISQVLTWKQPSENSIKKDVDVFLHTYTSRKIKKNKIMDSLDSPLRNLRLLKFDPNDADIQFILDKKVGMSPNVITYTCLDFLSRRDIKNFSLQKLALEPGSPGKILKITDTVIRDCLKQSSMFMSHFDLSYDGGETSIILKEDPTKLANILLRNIYKPTIKCRGIMK